MNNNSTSTHNRAVNYGGGINASANEGSLFNKTGGEITGFSSGSNPSFNKVETIPGTISITNGSAVYMGSSNKRETTVTEEQVLDWDGTTATGDWTD